MNSVACSKMGLKPVAIHSKNKIGLCVLGAVGVRYLLARLVNPPGQKGGLGPVIAQGQGCLLYTSRCV